MKKHIIISLGLFFVMATAAIVISSCAVSQKVQNKTGVQLWGENCGRCHNAPGPGEFNTSNWDIIGRHMRVRTNITENEEKMIIEYLKSSVN
ncbi:MAG: cytochrome c [Chitinophagales bacterium]